MEASERAKNLKKELVNTPEEEFEPLTFGEIKEGQKFITLPSPGDNNGHGGFRKAHWLFKKTENHVEEVKPGMSYHKDHPHGRAINTSKNIESDFPLSMQIILIE